MDGFVAQLLTLLGFQLPELLACVAGLAMLWMWTPAAPGRALAIGGMAAILGAALLRLVMSVTQVWMIHHAEGGYSMSGGFALFSAVGMLLGVLSSAGLVMLAWGACKAMLGAAVRA
ncbi:hypothetical protein [Pseudoxanthomonas putridarboris]|uniref:Uncharacterized protein n=1 Tax=Pseudoxanthomonas putridarboris TaxID=752605 RepID=A0ABU9J5V3_9GAMM